MPEVLSLVPEEITEGDLCLVKQWVVLNKAALVQHWRGESDSLGFIEALKKL